MLINANCEVRLCDFGLARAAEYENETNAPFLTEYVATRCGHGHHGGRQARVCHAWLTSNGHAKACETPREGGGTAVAARWYRAPEIMVSVHQYTKAIDLWSVGCILAEMLGGRPLFPGDNYLAQLNLVLAFTGTPSEDDFLDISNSRARDFVRRCGPADAGAENRMARVMHCGGRIVPDAAAPYALRGGHVASRSSLPYRSPTSTAMMYPDASPLALGLLERLLVFNPRKRITVDSALEHPYLALYHDPTDEPRAAPLPRGFFFFDGLKEELTIAQLKGMARRPRPPPRTCVLQWTLELVTSLGPRSGGD